MAGSRARRAGFAVEFLAHRAETIPLAIASVDTVVTTWTLCTIADPVRALAQIQRVLRPGGRLIFVEHGRSSDPRVVRWQDRLTPVWRRIAGGCHLNRPMSELIAPGGFEVTEMERGYIAGPRVAGRHVSRSGAPRRGPRRVGPRGQACGTAIAAWQGVMVQRWRAECAEPRVLSTTCRSEKGGTHGAGSQGWMGKRTVCRLRTAVGSLTGDAPDRRARGAGRGEWSARRQGGGGAGDPDPNLDGLARGGPRLRLPPG
jgi:hypothetical protein